METDDFVDNTDNTAGNVFESRGNIKPGVMDLEFEDKMA